MALVKRILLAALVMLSNSVDAVVPLFEPKPEISAVIAGGATAGFNKSFGDNSAFKLVDLNPLFLFSYQDLLLMRSAFDFSINDQGGTDVSLDNLNLNLFAPNDMIFSLGKFDSALGSFVRNLSPAWINKLPDAPIGFDSDQAAPQAEIGVQAHGTFSFTDHRHVNYTLFLANGPQAMVDTAAGLVDHISTDGFTKNYNNFTMGAKINVQPIHKLQLGFSSAIGQLALIDIADGTTLLQQGRQYSVVGADIAYKWTHWDVRAEFIQQQLVAQANSIVAASEAWKAWYLQTAYWIPNTKFEPVIRYAHYIAPIDGQNQHQWALGLDYWFTPSIAAQAAYELNFGQQGTTANANTFLMQLTFGY